MRVTILYFAVLREQSGCGSETVETAAANIGQLYDEVAARHALSVPPQALRAALDDAFADWDAPLHGGCTVAFLPPMRGG